MEYNFVAPLKRKKDWVKGVDLMLSKCAHTRKFKMFIESLLNVFISISYDNLFLVSDSSSKLLCFYFERL